MGLAQDDTATSQDPSDPCQMAADAQSDEFASDFQTCQQQKISADNCCANPNTCSGGGTFGAMGGGGGGMNQMIQMMTTMSAALLIAQASPGQMNQMNAVCQMMGMNNAGMNYNNSYINACNDSKQTCMDTCRQVREKWASRAQDMAVRCGTNTDAISVATNAAARVRAFYTQCSNMTANSSLSNQVNNYGNNNAALQNVCNQMPNQQMQAQSLQPMQPPQMPQPSGPPDCSNPIAVMQAGGLDACRAAAGANAVKDSATRPSFQAAQAPSSANNFNVSSGADGKLAQNPQFGDGSKAPPAGPGGGGMMPPGGGGGIGPFNQQSSAGGAGAGAPRQGARGGGSSSRADILQGERSGNGYSSPVGTVDASGTFSGYGTSDQVKNVDLRRYLPGAQLDRNRKLAGIGSINPDINTFTTDLFKRISDRFKVVCSMNRLRDCTYAKEHN